MANYKNRKEAWKYFWPEGKGFAKPGYVLHHVDDSLRHEDPDRYNEWRNSDLVMMTNKEHMSLHNKGVSKNVGNKHGMTRKVICITTGEIFECVIYAAEKFNVSQPYITMCCGGIRPGVKRPIGGYFVFKYLKNKIKKVIKSA